MLNNYSNYQYDKGERADVALTLKMVGNLVVIIFTCIYTYLG